MNPVASIVVIAARQFNPSILTQLWLVRNGILAEDEFAPGCIFTDDISQVQTNKFHLVAIPQQLQFAPNVSNDAEIQLLSDKLGGIVRALPHTPYTAIGLNFVYHKQPADVSAASKRAFFQPGSQLFRVFDTPTSHFGGYMSKDWCNMRLKLDIKPIYIEEGGHKENRLQFGFNFHRDLQAEHAVTQIQECLQLWPQAKAESDTMIESAIKDWNL